MPPFLPFWRRYVFFSLELSSLAKLFIFGRSLPDVSSRILSMTNVLIICFGHSPVVSLGGVVLIARPTFLFSPDFLIPHLWFYVDSEDSAASTDRLISVGYSPP